ncbi:ribosomal protein S18-alanine N-acetyltransferase [Solimonas marina]|uniref:[Ribosomal protein bS18]-alanine N-acetyltransferase n=1 Tax=Solimonas marina TaxID=2714601 RepID=A0A969WBZ9_9GAMM|nr:ribosomal protein S18-alanine N-acetyltransferase [Solimonas marina]NKF23320.1 ribosomal protein S18-alanine N-acetyltransferase [Solimonas marina]
MSAQPEDIWRLYPMHPSHLPQVMEIEQQAYTHPWTEGIFNDCLRVGYSAWVVTNTLGEVLAYALMSMAVGEAHVLNICVAPDQQRRGVAAFLLRHLLMVARAAGVTLVLLEVRRSNKAAQKLYENFGFAKIGERRGYYPAAEGREDAWVLSLELIGS